MTTFAGLLDSIKDDMLVRYRSPIWGAALIAIAASHWKIIVYLATESHKSEDAISFIEANVTLTSFACALFYAVLYVAVFPWIEYAIDWAAGHGKRKRNEFQTQEREKEISRRKIMAQQNEKALELELRNIGSQSKISDIELAKSYQGILSGENFGRWLADLQHGPVNAGLGNTIVNYLHKIDSTEGKFMNPIVESAHVSFANDLSTLLSALNDSRSGSVDAKKEEVVKFTRKAQESQKNYRELARELLGV